MTRLRFPEPLPTLGVNQRGNGSARLHLGGRLGTLNGVFARFRRPAKPVPLASWRNATLFSQLEADEADWLDQHVRTRDLEAGEKLLEEGETGSELFVILEGSLAVTKRETRTERAHRIKELGTGDVVGELEVLDPQGRAATVTALVRCRVAIIDLHELRTYPAPGLVSADAVYYKLVANLATSVAAKLRAGSEDALQSAHRRTAMGELIVNVIILLCLYVMLVAALSSRGLKPSNTMFLSLPLLSVFGFASWRFMRTSGYPLSEFGITGRGLARGISESALFTLVFLAVATLIKWILLHTDVSYENSALIQFPDVFKRFSEPKTRILVIVYAASAAVQELIVRGALQSMLQRFLTGPSAQTKAVVVCALLFSVSHLHTGVLFPLLVFFPGVLWGWLFARHRNLAGVILSHIVLGAYVFFVLGIRLGA